MSSPYRNVPPLNALAAFEAVARLRSFAGAANELCVTQSAVSHRIRQLESHYCEQLFFRHGRNVTLTTKGTYLLAGVLDALSILQKASLNVSNKSRQLVRVNVGPSFARYWLVRVLADFSRRYPELDLEINASKFMGTYKLASLRAKEWDVAICYGTGDEWKDFAAIKLTDGELFPVCSPAYRASCGALSRPEDLLKKVLLRLPHEPWSRWFEAAGVRCGEPEQGPIFSDASLMLDAALSGQGIALARSVLVHEHLVEQRLVRLFGLGLRSPSNYHAVFRPESIDRPEVRSFVTWLCENANRDSTTGTGTAPANVVPFKAHLPRP
ncbi:MAG: LysR family transcriptional regulator [Betaproteobacteria bacterium]|nr:LysR family transcriptional regulator [Betaproteobacteria bacterium]